MLELDLLVATTVLKWGVDVPNASLMIIEKCRAFGLITTPSVTWTSRAWQYGVFLCLNV